ncbi:ferric reductase like transmembrane component-domain-containing protein [Schizothecium vesticola]|uniref:Ferric reductase like transmembrane component-domain-containing protein n=1 Tax=Schizothecium vesticola TaxID=314040 RepID=A0AA40ELF5_9PEZI|nr:ferric reductase like transmembrane component-domain-containing protein [Schizothecium vesticola]
MKPTTRALPVAVALLQATSVLGDGTGFIGAGKTLYHPTCSFACRQVVRGCPLLCTPTDSGGENHGTAHNPSTTPPECYLKDDAFLRTVALCIDNYCTLSDNPPLGLIEDYWASHLGTGTLGNYKYTPAVSYQDALAAARADEARTPTNSTTTTEDHSAHGTNHRRLKARHFMDHDHGPHVNSSLPIIKAKAPLNVTSFITPSDWQMQYNGLYDFETNENGHTTNTLAIMLVAIFLPVPLSLLRFVPGLAGSRAWTVFQSALVSPAVYGKSHREPVVGGFVMAPTRGQTMYIFIISLLNLVLWLAPFVYNHPQGIFGSREEQEMSIIGNRAGVMAMGNVVALFLFAARNNFLLWVTDWSYSTFLLLHRWLGYWAVFHTVVHSLMLWFYYRTYGDYQAELARSYWVFGICATAAVVAIFLLSLLPVRKHIYEFFLFVHIALALVFIITYYYHIWYVYEYNWGYEIYAFMAAGIWATDRLLRLVRIALRGYRTATVTVLQDTDGEYLRIKIHGVQLGEGVAYLSFPTLGWRVWESHPFSVVFNSSEVDESTVSAATALLPETKEIPSSESKEVTITEVPASPSSDNNSPVPKGPTTTFFARVRDGLTQNLALRANAGPASLGAVVDGPYHHSGNVTTLLKPCSNVVYLAGGVGITALLPYARSIAKPSQLFWSTRKAGLSTSMRTALSALPPTVEVDVSSSQRLDVISILEKAMAVGGLDGPVGIVVCGPPGMADDIRLKVVQLARSGAATRPYVLVDEAFGW